MWIFTLTDNWDMQAVGLSHRHVLHRMHREIYPAVQKRLFQFFEKQPLAALFCQRHIQRAITLSRDPNQFNMQTTMGS